MNNKSVSAIEEELLSSISGDFKVGDVLATIVGAAEEAGDAVADGWLDIVQETLAEKSDIRGMMKLLLVRGQIGRISRKAIEKTLEKQGTECHTVCLIAQALPQLLQRFR